MADPSDTESESGSSVNAWDPADFMQKPVGMLGGCEALVGSVEVMEALRSLREVDICAIIHDARLLEQDASSLETIQSISQTLLSPLDRILTTQQWAESDQMEFQTVLATLLSEPTLDLLLSHRVLFRDIAARHLEGSTSAVAVCWVDVVLARLGQAIVRAAGLFHNVLPAEGEHPESLRAKKEDDLLRAATQLPERWQDIVEYMGSEYASPAAIRLASILTWGLNVMAKDLTGNWSLTSTEREKIVAKALQQRISHIALKRSQAVPWLAPTDDERMSCALFISLFAMSELTGGDKDPPCRPQTHAILIEMIQFVVHSDCCASSSHDFLLGAWLDLPHVILIKWGRALPWAWRSWNDTRLYQSDVVESLTATWLHHLNTPIPDVRRAHSTEWWDDELVETLERAPQEALSMMSRLIRRYVNEANHTTPEAPHNLNPLNIVLKACWSIKHTLSHAHTDDASLSSLCIAICELFILLGDAETDLGAKDLIIETISMCPTAVRLAIDTIAHQKFQCASGWERKLSRAYRLVKAKSLGDDGSTEELRSVRQTLQFLALTLRAGVSSFIPDVAVQQLLTTILDWLEFEKVNSPIWDMLGDATIGALAEWEHHIRPEDRRPAASRLHGAELIWRLAEVADPLDLPLAASLAAYYSVSAQCRPCDELVYCEAWDHLRDTMLLVLDHEFGVAQEPLALLVAPAICTALTNIASYAPTGAKQYYMSSPWTLCMVAKMKRLERDRERADEYDRLLWELISSSIERLLSHLEAPSLAEPRACSGDMDTTTKSFSARELTFCWVHSRACLIPT
ncbi:hypothetical protein BD414DRAFT_479747 [Trametes punicea]|nr:hypothetical protein BD414DRAFT_479747 [Trametes punicea]